MIRHTLLPLAFALAALACSTGSQPLIPGAASDGGAPPSAELPANDGGAANGDDMDVDPAPNANPNAGPNCAKYLSCVLAVNPESYAAQLTLYGEESACWKTSKQRASCEKACTAAFGHFEDECRCTGSECVAVPRLDSGFYVIESSTIQDDPCSLAHLITQSATHELVSDVTENSQMHLKVRLGAQVDFVGTLSGGKGRLTLAPGADAVLTNGSLDVELTGRDRFSAKVDVTYDNGGQGCRLAADLQMRQK